MREKTRTNPPRQKSTMIARRKLLKMLQQGEVGINCTNAELQGADLRGLKLLNVDFTGADLKKADLRGSDLSGSIFRNANLSFGVMRGTNLTKADFRDADLTGTDLTGALMHKAVLWRARMVGARFFGADLTEASFGGPLEDVDGSGFFLLEKLGANWDEWTIGRDGKNKSGKSQSFPLEWWAGASGFRYDEQLWIVNPIVNLEARKEVVRRKRKRWMLFLLFLALVSIIVFGWRPATS